jgi:solute carrier family 25 carnitine/acylcarnitine transporter 20/29
LFRGLGAPLVGYTAESAINYTAFGQMRHFLEQRHERAAIGDVVDGLGAGSGGGSGGGGARAREDGGGAGGGGDGGRQHATAASVASRSAASRLGDVAVAGGVAGLLLSTVVAPTDLIKCRVQDGQYKGPIAAFKDIVHYEAGATQYPHPPRRRHVH